MRVPVGRWLHRIAADLNQDGRFPVDPARACAPGPNSGAAAGPPDYSKFIASAGKKPKVMSGLSWTERPNGSDGDHRLDYPGCAPAGVAFLMGRASPDGIGRDIAPQQRRQARPTPSDRPGFDFTASRTAGFRASPLFPPEVADRHRCDCRRWKTPLVTANHCHELRLGHLRALPKELANLTWYAGETSHSDPLPGWKSPGIASANGGWWTARAGRCSISL